MPHSSQHLGELQSLLGLISHGQRTMDKFLHRARLQMSQGLHATHYGDLHLEFIGLHLHLPDTVPLGNHITASFHVG